MSTDEAVTQDIIESLEDGKDGFTKGAEKLEGLHETDLVATFRELAGQRTRFADELQSMAHDYGDDVDRSGSLAAKAHRGWMSLKDALGSSDAGAVLDVAAQGETHAVSEYEKALGEDISDGLRRVLDSQFAEIKAARDSVAALASARS